MNKELKERLNKDWSLYANPKYRWFCIGQNIKDKIGDIKASKERARYCVSSQDVWSFDNYLLRVLYNGLLTLKDEQMGFPSSLTEEIWDSELDKAIYWCKVCLTEEHEDENVEQLYNTYSILLSDESSNKKSIEDARIAWCSARANFNKHKQECLDNLMDWLKLWMWDLWW